MIRKSLCFLALIAWLASVAIAVRAEDSTDKPAGRNAVSQPTDLSKVLSPEEMKAAGLKTCIQPSYDAWDKVQPGMTLDEVRELLGEPIEENRPRTEVGALLEASGAVLDESSEAKRIEKSADEGIIYAGRMVFGKIEFESSVIPHSYNYEIIFAGDKVLEKMTRFRADLSPTDKPTRPVLISPHFNARIAGEQDIVDLRWAPSSGAYPMRYDVDVQRFQGDDPPRWLALADERNYETVELIDDIQLPHAAISVPSGVARWRVRGKNEHGESEWSEWRQIKTIGGSHFNTLLLQQLPAFLDTEK